MTEPKDIKIVSVETIIDNLGGVEQFKKNYSKIRLFLLKCVNCEHKDILDNFIKVVDMYHTSTDFVFIELKGSNKIKSTFTCPKCNSGAVVLCKESVPDIFAEAL